MRHPAVFSEPIAAYHQSVLRLKSCIVAALALAWIAGCSEAEPVASSPTGPERDSPQSAWVEIGGVLFELELALDPHTRYRGLGGRRFISPTGGMLFVTPDPRPQSMVMRDCPIPIDVAFLDLEGRVLSIHEMQPEPPRQSDENSRAYEKRLSVYQSGAPAGFAVETAGGRLAELGVRAGDTFILDTGALLEIARRSAR